MVEETMDMNLENDPSVKFGKYLAHPLPGEDIVISGMSGMFPLTTNIDEYKYNLYNKVSMVSNIPQKHPELPCGLGNFKPGDISKFDTGFFGISKKEARTMSQMNKLLLTKCIECIFDAGLHPEDLEGTRTGVYCGICFNDNEQHWFFNELVEGGNAICGNMPGMMANRISYFLKLRGPSMTTDTACSSSLYSLENAYVAIRRGLIDKAIVCGANSVLASGFTLQFARLGVLSKEGVLRSFDEDGKGYVRADAISAVLLQKSKDSNRIYATIVHTKTNCDGYKEQGITYPSGDTQLNLLKEIYLESGVNPHDISFIEAHGTGTPVGDPEEMNGIDTFFAKGRARPLLVGSVKSSIGHTEGASGTPVGDPEEMNGIDTFFAKGRARPLLVGSVKSSIGHTEGASGLCSIVKAILALESNIISPNINFKTPRKTVPGFKAGRIKVVVERTPFQDQNGLVGISNFGFGGGNAHLILKGNTKSKINNGKPLENLPRLVCVSGRTEDAVTCLLNDVAEKNDVEHIALIHNAFRKLVKNHLFRGYVIISKQGVMKHSVTPFNLQDCYLNISFGTLSRNSGLLAQELLSLPLLANFKNSLIQFCTKKNLSFNSLLSNKASSNENILLSGVITQLSLSELLKQLQIEYKSVFGSYFGEFTAAYFKNSLSLEQVLESIYVVAELARSIEMTESGDGILALARYKSEIQTAFERIIPKHFDGQIGTGAETRFPAYFVEAISQSKPNGSIRVTRHSVILEVGQSLNLYKTKQVHAVSFDTESGFQGVLETLGILYEHGVHPRIQKLYPEVQFPVSRGTPMISSMIKWKNDCEYFVPSFELINVHTDAMIFKINLGNELWAKLTGHIIDGRNLFPATGYLYLAWYLFSEVKNIELKQMKVVFENCQFKRACMLPKNNATNNLELIVQIQNVSGKFEISERNNIIVTGQIKDDEGHEGLPEVIGTSLETDISQDDLLNSTDIYKELRLRGYHYKGLFKGLIQCNKSGTSGKIHWNDDWIAFMDNMLQLNILAKDTRLLYVPTRIARISINPIDHRNLVARLQNGDKNKAVDIPIKYDLHTGSVRSGGIEIRGLLASSIPRKKSTSLPVLEKYHFIPNESRLPLEQSVRVFVQVALENNCGFNVKVAEIIENPTDESSIPLAPIIQDVLEAQPLVKVEITVLPAETMELPDKVNNEFSESSNYSIIVGKKLLTKEKKMAKIIAAAADEGFILSREPLNSNINSTVPSDLIILNISESNGEKLVFLRKQSKNKTAKSTIYVNVSTNDPTFSWLKKLKNAVTGDCNVIAWSQNEPLNGIIGLVNCIRRESGCQDVRSVFIVDNAPDFDPTAPFYKNQLDKNMVLNVFKNGQWGTYRHLLLETIEEVESEHCFVNSIVRGDLSSLKWFEGPLTRNTLLEINESLIDVYYASINFRDIMIASGRINVDVITHCRREQECVQGFEFSGKTKSGKKVMGIIPQGALATLIKADNYLMWEVPDHWTLKEAATVPVVYSTCLHALVAVGKIKATDSVLIHSGTGGIGQAAINLCLHMGCDIYTTVGTEEKRQFILKNFPQIKASHIGTSRDLSFEQMIYKETDGRGVDIVLNSLAEDKLLASARCLKVNGRFLEIGKFDLANDNPLNLLYFKEGASYHGVMLDKFFAESAYVKERLHSLIQKYIDTGVIKPLMTNVFEKHEVEQAFRFMTAGKHMGKVLIEVRTENDPNVDGLKFKGLPRYFCDPDKSYIICGGLGGFGLELADWLILRGAKNLVLSSRNGISNGYQSYRLSIWKRYSCKIKISTQDIMTQSECEELIREANNLAPVDAIFNLAVVLEDALLENQTQKSFETSFGPKAYATANLDEISRKMCPHLRDFVTFSSVSCGRGNAGQSNYGMSNSVMERICENRRKEGYPALAIQWGAIGDVGLVAALQQNHIELEIGGTLQQSIADCLQVMDLLLRQNEACIVSSMIVAEKKTALSCGKVEEVIGGILGIRDIKLVSLSSTLAELGMDSMTAVEIKQTLEREYNIFLTPSEIRSVTLADIKELSDQKSSAEKNISGVIDNIKEGFNPIELFKNYYQNDCVEGIVKLKAKKAEGKNKNVPRIIAFPGVEGYCDLLENLTANMEVDAYGINYQASEQKFSYPETAEKLLSEFIDLLKPQKTFHIIAHSIGSLVALELVGKLEKLGFVGTLTLLDGSPSYLKKILNVVLAAAHSTDLDVENAVLASTLRLTLTESETMKAVREMSTCQTLQDKLNVWLSYLRLDGLTSKEIFLRSVISLIMRTKEVLNYEPTFGKLKSKVRLYKPSMISVNMALDNYDLGQYCEQPVDVKVIQGHHRSILTNEELAISIMKDLSDE